MSSAIPLPISMSGYLRSSDEPDCDYMDGVVEQRSAGSPGQQVDLSAASAAQDQRRI